MSSNDYVHGYSERESSRLSDQAGTLAELLHRDTLFADGGRVLEAGCGIGAQTAIVAPKNPRCRFTSIDISVDSIDKARATLAARAISNVTLQQADIFSLPFEAASFDHVFVCFVLEHLPHPQEALARLLEVLKPGGTLTVIEGDHGSWFCQPPSDHASHTVRCLIEAQAHLGGDALIGRRLFPLLIEAGLGDVVVSPRMVYADASRPQWVEGFSHKTFIAMVEGAREMALSLNLTDELRWAMGIRDLKRATEADGTFCYTFFKATAVKGL